MQVWKGVICAIVTPLKKGGNAVDPHAMREYCDFLIDKGIDGIFAFGTTGEGPLLSLSERKSMAEALVASVDRRVRVIVQTGCIRAEETIDLTRHCRKIGADAAGIVLPYYYPLSDEAIFEHFLRIAEAVSDFPLFVYNIPECTGNDLSPELFRRLVDSIETIVGLKTSSRDLSQAKAYIRTAEGRCPVFIGCDSIVLAVLCLGAGGIVSGTASAFPEPFVDLYEAFGRGEVQRARECQWLIDRLLEVTGDGDIASFKKALDFRGINVGSVREPHRDLSPEEAAKLRDSLRETGIVP